LGNKDWMGTCNKKGVLLTYITKER
jgi:hypothetical protein